MSKSTKIVPLLFLAATLLIAGIAATPATLMAPEQPTVTATDNPGELQVSWNQVPGAQHYTVGYASPGEMNRMADAGRNRLDAFYYVTVEATNASHTFTGLEPETVYWVTVGAQTKRFGATDLVWARQHAIATTAGQHGDGFCPITGLPIPEDGYLTVGDTIASDFGGYSFTLTSASAPASVSLGFPDNPSQLVSPRSGQRFVRVCGTFRHNSDGEAALALGQSTTMDSDAGVGLTIRTSHENVPAQTDGFGCEVWEIPATAKIAIYAVNVVSHYSETGAIFTHQAELGLYRIDLTDATLTDTSTIVFSDLNWSHALIQNRIAQYIVEKGYSYSTGVRFGATSTLIQSLRSGETDVFMELWLPNQEEAYMQATAAGEVISLGENYRDWQSAFVIPAYLQEQYPELDSVEDLKDPQYRQLFATAETGDKARLVSCVVGWACETVNAAQVEGYGLSDHVAIINPGDHAALNADLHDAYEREAPWLGYQWGTNDPALLLDLMRLEEPPYSDECWATTKACAYEDSTVLIAANYSLPENAPDVAEMLRQWDFAIDPIYKGIVRWQDQNPDADVNATALWWLNNNADIWEQWVTDAAATSIHAALTANETPDGWPDE